MTQNPQQDLRFALERMALLHPGEQFNAETLAGGVSSDILRIDLPGRSPAVSFCFKRALAKLKVAADWRAPVERNHAEVEWMRVADRLAPGCVPRILGEDVQAGAFAMEYLAPAAHPVWKNQLRDGDIRAETAAAVAQAIAAVHAGTARRAPTSRSASPTTTSSTRSGWSPICLPPRRAIRTAPCACANWSRSPRAPSSRWCTAI